jgi:hypothetical protein
MEVFSYEGAGGTFVTSSRYSLTNATGAVRPGGLAARRPIEPSVRTTIAHAATTSTPGLRCRWIWIPADRDHGLGRERGYRSCLFVVAVRRSRAV